MIVDRIMGIRILSSHYDFSRLKFAKILVTPKIVEYSYNFHTTYSTCRMMTAIRESLRGKTLDRDYGRELVRLRRIPSRYESQTSPAPARCRSSADASIATDALPPS